MSRCLTMRAWRAARVAGPRSVMVGLCLWLLIGLAAGMASAAAAAGGPVELDDAEYQALQDAAGRLDHLALVPPADGGVGVWLVIADRFGLVRVVHVTHGAARDVWKSKQLNGVVDEVIAADLDDDGIEEIIARTNSGIIYVWSMPDMAPRYESLTTDFQKVHALAVGNMDGDEFCELIVNADRHLYYLDGRRFNREWTSLNEYECTRMRCGDVDGDRTNELVLNTGQVIDGRTGDVEWSDEVFGVRLDLVDVDGDGLPEVVTESDGAPLRIYDVDLRKEKHLQ